MSDVNATYVNAAVINAGTITSRDITSNNVNARSFGGTGGDGAVLTCSKIILSGYIITAKEDGIYVTVPQGFETKVELCDPRAVPIPPESQESLNGPPTVGQ